MNPEITNTIEHLRDRKKKQIELFSKLSAINKKELSVKDFIQQSVHVISNDWIDPDPIAVEVSFNDIVITSKNFSERSWNIEYKGEEIVSSNLVLKIYYSNKKNDTDENQMLVDSIANNLASNIELIMTQEELLENREIMEKAYRLGRIGTWDYNMSTGDLHWSNMTKEIHGFGPDHKPDLESTTMQFVEGYHRDTYKKAVEDAIQKQTSFDLELKIINAREQELWIRISGEAEYKDGVCVRFYGVTQNVTDRKELREQLKLSERRFRVLIQDGSDMISIMDEDAVYTYVSPTKFKVLGLSPAVMIGKSALEFIHKDDIERTFSAFKDLAYKDQVLLKPFRFIDVNGNWRWLESTVTNLTKDPAVKGYVANSRDITEQYLRQQRLEGSLKKKDLMLSEIHHRIKNNLSSITGLLQVQSLQENNKEVVERLSDSVNRIHAMSSMHELLYQSQNFTKLDISEQIKILALNVQKTMQSEADVELDFQIEKIKIQVNKALPTSMIINEILTNIFKHAFKGLKKGKISIYLKKMKQNKVKIDIKDNGIGLPDDLENKRENSIGLMLVESMTRQMSATYTLKSSDKGTTFSMII